MSVTVNPIVSAIAAVYALAEPMTVNPVLGPPGRNQP
jgi:hypothetical protein